MSPSSIQVAEVLLDKAIKQPSMASWVDRFGLNPYAFGSALSSAIGTKAACHTACMQRSFIAGIESGLSFPDFLGICIRLDGRGVYPLLFSSLIIFIFWFGVFNVTPSTPGVLRPLLLVTRFTAKHRP